MHVIDVIHQHRSIRKYKPDPVPEDLLSDILLAGTRASSSGNMQTYSIIVTRDLPIRQQLYKPHFEQDMVLDAPVLLTFCADFNRMRKWLKLSEAPDNFDNFMSFMIGAIDAVLVSQNVALAAESHGLGICYMGTTLASCDEIAAILNLPPNVVPVTGFSLGYPAENPPTRYRLPLDGVVHYETYQDYSDEQIAEIYHEKEEQGWQRYMAYPEIRARVLAAGAENLAQIYTKVKYSRETHQDYSQTVLNLLQKQDFFNNGLCEN